MINNPDTDCTSAENLAEGSPSVSGEQRIDTLIFKKTLDFSAEGITLCNEEGVTILWNKKLEEITGILEEETLGKKIWDVHYMLIEESQKTAPYYDQLKKSLSKALTNGVLPGMGQVFGREYIRPDGEKIFVEGSIYSIDTGSGYLLASITRDISGRIQAEKALKQSEQRLQSIFNSAPIGIALLSNRIFLEVNDYTCHLLGYKKEELIGKDAQMIYPSRDNYDFVGKELYDQILNSGKGSIQIKLQHKDGKGIDVVMSAAALDHAAIDKGITFTALDITEREKAREELFAAAQRWKTTFNAVKDATCIIDSEMRIVQYNQAMMKMFPEQEGHLEGKKCFEIVHGTDQPIDDCPIVRGRKSLKRERLELSLADKALEITVDPLLDESGSFRGAVHSIRDITERVVAEKALENSNRIINNSPAVAFIWKNEEGWPIEHVTENVTNLLGFSVKEVLDTNFAYNNIIYQDDADQVAKEVKNAIEKRLVSFTHEPYRIIDKDQNIKWVRDITSLRYDQRGNATHFEGIVYDISGEIFATEKLKIRTRQLEMILDANLSLNESLELDKMLQMAAASARNLLEIGSTAIYLLRGEDLYLGATSPPLIAQLPERFQLARLEDHPHIRQAISSRRPVVMEDALKGELTLEEKAASEARNLRTILYLPIIVGQKSLGVLILGTTNEKRVFDEDEINIGKTLAAQIAASLRNAILHDQSNQHARDLERQVKDTEIAEERAKTLARQIIHLQEDERKRISREMHDEMGQLLTTISLNVWNLGHSLEQHTLDQIQQKLLGIKDLVDELDDKVGEIAQDLRPPMLDDLGLAPTLRWYVDSFADRTEIEVDLEIGKEVIKLPREIETALYRITQEALTNVVKHAGATRVTIDLVFKPSGVSLTINDDGKGFELNKDDDHLPLNSHGMGLIGIKDRVDLLGGVVNVHSSPGVGTLIEVEIPLSSAVN